MKINPLIPVGSSIKVDKSKIEDKLHIKKIKIIPFSKKEEWNLIAKYNIGKY